MSKAAELKQAIKEAEYRRNSETAISLIPRLGEGARLLDIGCAEGSLTLRYAEKADVSRENVYGIEIDPENLAAAKTRIEAVAADMESEALPFAEAVFDLVVCNQILEHIKNLRHFMGQVDRVVKRGGYLLISVPNLAAAHNRLGLLFARQPRCINVRSTHVRGFTPAAAKDFLTHGGRFEVVSAKGSGFYPLPTVLSKPVSRLAPTMAVYYTMLLRKTVSDGWESWLTMPEA